MCRAPGLQLLKNRPCLGILRKLFLAWLILRDCKNRFHASFAQERSKFLQCAAASLRHRLSCESREHIAEIRRVAQHKDHLSLFRKELCMDAQRLRRNRCGIFRPIGNAIKLPESCPREIDRLRRPDAGPRKHARCTGHIGLTMRHTIIAALRLAAQEIFTIFSNAAAEFQHHLRRWRQQGGKPFSALLLFLHSVSILLRVCGLHHHIRLPAF